MSLDFRDQIVILIQEYLQRIKISEKIDSQEVANKERYFVKLDEALPASTDFTDDLDNLSSALAYHVTRAADGTRTLSTTDSITLFNPSTGVSYETGEEGWYEYICGIPCFIPFTAGDGSGGGGCCCCETVDVPTAVLSTGEWTTDRRVPCAQIGTVYDDYQSDTNVKFEFDLPAPASMIVVKETASDDYVWTFDETDVTITAEYADEETATITSLDGTVTFKPHDSGKTSTKIEWTAVFPVQEEGGSPP